MERRIPNKLFFKIGEVCELTETQPYVLRYWESEFPFLAPEKNRAGQRIYTDEDIQTVLAIKRLLYEDGYTTAGARRKLEQERLEPAARGLEEAAPSPGEPAPAGAATVAPPASPPAEDDEARAALRRLREDLKALRASLGDP